MFEYIEGWYNPRRRHSTLGYLSPAEYEQQHAERLRAALESPPSSNGSVVSITLTTPRRTSPLGPAPIAASHPQLDLGSATGSAQAATTMVEGRTAPRRPLRWVVKEQAR